MTRLRERGAVTLEFGFVAPLIVLFLIAAAEVGLVVIGNSAGSNAAREAARVATVRYECADNHVSAQCPVGSPNLNTIKATALGRLAGLVRLSTFQVSVICRQGSATGPVELCERSVVTPDHDVVEVTVSWDHLGTTKWVPGTRHSSTARMVILGQPDLTVTPPDLTPPGLLPPILATDVNADGILETISMTFDEDISQTVSAAAFTVTNSPTGSNTISSATVSARSVTLTIAGSTVNTAPGTMKVALAASSSGVLDGVGNRASFAATAVSDRAGPVLVGLTDTPGVVDGQMGIADTLTLTFSEPIGTTLGLTTVVESDPASTANDSVSIGGVTAGPQITNSNAYITTDNTSVATNAVITKAGNTVIVTISTPLVCSPITCLGLGIGVDTAAFSLTPATSLVDAANNAARGSRTISNIF